jgi:serine/threonine-protein kinase HipA
VRDPSPLAGVQRKIALTQLQDGRFGIPKPGLRVPTTHILKVPGRNNQREPRLERAAALLAEAVGIEVAVPIVLGIEGLSALLVPRFDRRVGQDGAVRRIHQEDFAQALGLPAGLKYERHGREDRRFDIVAILRILESTAEPAISKRNFISATIFNMIVGNSDNHAKNHALLYDKGAIPRLAPLYDILPVRLDGGITHDFSFRVGAADRFDALTRSDLFSFFHSLGLSRAAVRRFVKDTIAPMIDQINQATTSFAAQGLKDFDDLIGRESERLMEVLEIKVPIRPHDHYSPRGGGWSMGS